MTSYSDRVTKLRSEVRDKLDVFALAAQNPVPLQRAIVQQQCQDFLMEIFGKVAKDADTQVTFEHRQARMMAQAADSEKAEAKHWRERAEKAEKEVAEKDRQIAELEQRSAPARLSEKGGYFALVDRTDRQIAALQEKLAVEQRRPSDDYFKACLLADRAELQRQLAEAEARFAERTAERDKWLKLFNDSQQFQQRAWQPIETAPKEVRQLIAQWRAERDQLNAAAARNADLIAQAAWCGQALGRSDCARQLDAILAASEGPPSPHGKRWTEVLCQKCGGNGVVNIEHGTSVCDRCDGRCYEPEPAQPYPPVCESNASASPMRHLIAQWRERSANSQAENEFLVSPGFDVQRCADELDALIMVSEDRPSPCARDGGKGL